MKYLKRRKWALLVRTVCMVWCFWFAIRFAFIMLTENPKIDYLTGVFLTVVWLFSLWAVIDFAKGIWKIVKENIDVYNQAG